MKTEMNPKTKNVIFISSVVAFFLLVFGLAGNADMNDQIIQNKQYCEMVELFKSSNGEYGWPDYNSNYDKVCEVKL